MTQLNYIDLSKYEAVKEYVYEESKDMSVVSGELVLEIPIVFLKANMLRYDTPVQYKGGIFRVSDIRKDEARYFYVVTIKGKFRSNDPNGIKTNGWRPDEMNVEDESDVSAISYLEI